MISTFCIVFPLISHADPGPPDPNDAPIDGGVSLLIAAGAAYGLKKFRAARKKEQEEDLKL